MRARCSLRADHDLPLGGGRGGGGAGGGGPHPPQGHRPLGGRGRGPGRRGRGFLHPEPVVSGILLVLDVDLLLHLLDDLGGWPGPVRQRGGGGGEPGLGPGHRHHLHGGRGRAGQGRGRVTCRGRGRAGHHLVQAVRWRGRRRGGRGRRQGGAGGGAGDAGEAAEDVGEGLGHVLSSCHQPRGAPARPGLITLAEGDVDMSVKLFITLSLINRKML